LLSGLSRRPLLAALSLMAASTVAMAALEARPRDGRDVAAIFPPWVGATDAFGRVAQAGGVVVRQGIVDAILVAHGDDPEFATRLEGVGAWLVLDPIAFGGCLTRSSNFDNEGE